MYAEQIVKYINAVLQSKLSGKQFQQGRYFSIAKQIVRNKDNVPFVVIFDNEGNDTSDFINDKYSLVVYHRMTGYSFFPVEQNQKDSFGDGAKEKGLMMNMVMVVYGDRNRLKLTNEELSSLIYVYFPSELEQSLRVQLTGLDICLFSPVSTNNNSTQVMQSEGIICEQENILFSINYQIKEVINTTCLGGCDFHFDTDSLCFEMCAAQAGATFTLPTFKTNAGQNDYQIDILKGKVIAFVLFDNMPLKSNQYSLNNGLFSLTDTTFAIMQDQEVTIGYR